jgi:hypothetical protein
MVKNQEIIKCDVGRCVPLREEMLLSKRSDLVGGIPNTAEVSRVDIELVNETIT